MVRRLGRWLAIKLLVFSALRKEVGDASHKVYRILPGLYLVGQAPGKGYPASGAAIFCLMNDLAQHAPCRIILREPGAVFIPNGLICALPGPGSGWAWYVRVGK